MKLHEKGKRRSLWLPINLDKKAEEARLKLGLERSGFYRYAIIEVIKQFVLAPTRENPQEKRKSLNNYE